MPWLRLEGRERRAAFLDHHARRSRRDTRGRRSGRQGHHADAAPKSKPSIRASARDVAPSEAQPAISVEPPPMSKTSA